MPTLSGGAPTTCKRSRQAELLRTAKELVPSAAKSWRSEQGRGPIDVLRYGLDLTSTRGGDALRHVEVELAAPRRGLTRSSSTPTPGAERLVAVC